MINPIHELYRYATMEASRLAGLLYPIENDWNNKFVAKLKERNLILASDCDPEHGHLYPGGVGAELAFPPCPGHPNPWPQETYMIWDDPHDFEDAHGRRTLGRTLPAARRGQRP